MIVRSVVEKTDYRQLNCAVMMNIYHTVSRSALTAMRSVLG